MCRTLYILFALLMEILLNWYCYYKIEVPVNFGDLIFIFGVVLLTLILSVIILVKRFNIADYWIFAKEHPFAYRFIGMFTFISSLQHAKTSYELMGVLIFILFNTALLFLLMIDEEDTKRRKEIKENRKNSDCIFGEEFE